MLGLGDCFDHVVDLGNRRVVGNDGLVMFEAYLGASDSFDRKQC